MDETDIDADDEAEGDDYENSDDEISEYDVKKRFTFGYKHTNNHDIRVPSNFSMANNIMNN